MSQEQEEAYRARYDPSVRPRHAVITTIAGIVDVEPTELEASVYESVELEALDTLLLHEPGTDISVTFAFEGNRITARVDQERRVVVAVEHSPE